VAFRFAMRLQHRQLDRRHALPDGKDRLPILSRGEEGGGIGEIVQRWPSFVRRVRRAGGAAPVKLFYEIGESTAVDLRRAIFPKVQ